MSNHPRSNTIHKSARPSKFATHIPILNVREPEYRKEITGFSLQKVMAVVEWQCFEEWQTLTQEGIPKPHFTFQVCTPRYTRRIQLPTKQQVKNPNLASVQLMQASIKAIKSEDTRVALTLRNFEVLKKVVILT